MTCRVCDRPFEPVTGEGGFRPARCATCIEVASRRIASAEIDRARAAAAATDRRIARLESEEHG
jgi:hypothetical protein